MNKAKRSFIHVYRWEAGRDAVEGESRGMGRRVVKGVLLVRPF